MRAVAIALYLCKCVLLVAAVTLVGVSADLYPLSPDSGDRCTLQAGVQVLATATPNAVGAVLFALNARERVTLTGRRVTYMGFRQQTLMASVTARNGASGWVSAHALGACPAPNRLTDWKYFAQCDKRWAATPLGTCGTAAGTGAGAGTAPTLCTAGSAQTAVAMVLASRGVASATPLSVSQWLRDAMSGTPSAQCDAFRWSAVDRIGGGVTRFASGSIAVNYEDLCWYAAQNYGVLLPAYNFDSAGAITGTHWVLLVGCDAGAYIVHDPTRGAALRYSTDQVSAQAELFY